MPDARISELPLADAPTDADRLPLVQGDATPETRRATLAQLRAAVLAPASGTVALGGLSGGQALDVAAPAGTVNRAQVTGAAAGGAVVLGTAGADATVGLTLAPKGGAALRGPTPAVGAAGTELVTAAWVAGKGYAPLTAPAFTGSLGLPTWTTATRPAAPAPGTEGFNTTTGRRETWTGGAWGNYVRLGGDVLAGPLTLSDGSYPFPARALRAGAWEGPAGLTNTVSATVGGGRLHAMPVDLLAPATLDRIAAVMTAAAPSAMQVRYGLYADGGGGPPGALLLDAGTVALASGAAAGSVIATISYAVAAARRLWLAHLSDTTASWQVSYNAPMDLPLVVPMGAAGWQPQGWYVNGVSYGALPASPTWLRNDQASNAPVLSVRVGSLP